MIVVGRAISTHTPHARRDLVIVSLFSNALRFQLTRLMRGVTTYLQSMIVVGRAISTHTPHARRDLVIVSLFSNALRFQLTRLMRGVTLQI